MSAEALPSFKNPQFQDEAKCTTFLVKMTFIYILRMKNDYHFKGWAPTLVLKQRPEGTRKWPIGSLEKEQIKSKFYNYDSFLDEK